MQKHMLWCLDPAERVGPIVRAALPIGLDVRSGSVEEWARMRALGQVWCTVIDAALLAHPEFRLRVKGGGPISGLTDCVALHSGPLSAESLDVGAAVPVMHSSELLWPATRAVGARTTLFRLHRAAWQAAGYAHPRVVRAVSLASTAPAPFTQVQALENAIDCKAGSLRHTWKPEMVDRGAPTLKQTVNGILLVRMIEHCTGPVDPARLRRQWRIGPDRGHDIAMQLVGGGYRSAKGAGFPALLGWIRVRLIEVLRLISARAVPGLGGK